MPNYDFLLEHRLKELKPCRSGWTKACFFCNFADFRTPEFIRRAEELPQGEKLYSVCHNEKNRKKENQS